MSVAITLTTIHQPVLLENVLSNAQTYQHRDIALIVVGDKKTPSGVKEYCENLHEKFGMKCQYLDISFQDNYLKRFPKLAAYLPYNSFARRNIGDLLAYEEGYDVIIRIDDDNFPTEGDFVGRHQFVGGERWLTVVSSDNNWYNVCECLPDADKIPFYPRGFPYSKRWKACTTSASAQRVKVALNAGLWVGDPDVDATTRLCKPINAIEYRPIFGEQFALAVGTWCPINTQNTAYARRLMPAAFIPKNVGRYDDIWSGYLLRRIMDHMGDYISYGLPLLRQVRNKHNLWHDFELELNGNLYTDHLLECMSRIRLSKTSYAELYYELAEKLDNELKENRDVFSGVLEGMRIWVETIDKIK